MANSGAAQRPHPIEDLGRPPDFDPDRSSLFLDLDGTIAPLELTPQAVAPDAARRRLLDALVVRLDGRLAVISGRPLADLDRVLEGRVRAVGAVHGLVRRTSAGKIEAAPGEARLRAALAEISAYAATDSRLLVEDKALAVALHYRRVPEAAVASRDLMQRLASRLDLQVQEGDMVVEVRVDGPDKGAAIAAFMSEAPFAGGTPVFLGDDLTDEDGFRAVREQGGVAIVVGPRRPTGASYALPGVEAARAWLWAGLGGETA